MSDAFAEKVQQDVSAVTPPPEGGRSITLTITLQPNGQLELSGPLMNKVLANGLLGAAAQELHRLHLMKELEAMATKANGGGINGLLKKMGRG